MTLMGLELRDERPLTVADRCDRCGAQAYVLVRLTRSGLDMLFCGHHFDKNEAALAGCAEVVTDLRDELRGGYR